jgi:hypothetical protein
MGEEFNRDFKGVWIPKEVWLDSRLNALDKIILTEIDSLDQGEKGCFASNKYIADFCQCSETKVSTAVSKLVQLGYLQVKKFDGRQRELKSSLSNFERQTFKNLKADLQNLKDINIKSNTLTNTKKESGKAVNRFTPPTLEQVQEYCRERQNNIDPQRFIDYYAARGWLIGKNKMKDWKAAVRTWERTGYSSNVQSQQKASKEAAGQAYLEANKDVDAQLAELFGGE